MFDADLNIGRSNIRRIKVVKVEDKGEIQEITVEGLADEEFKLSYRGQAHGMTTVPMKDSVGYLFMANGRPDQAFIFGCEHPDKRKEFADRKEGESTMYAKKNQEVFMDKDGNTHMKTPNGIIYINCA